MTKKDDDEKTDAHEALDVNVDASTKTIKAQFRRKARDLQSQRAAGVPASKKTFEELNEAYQSLIKSRHKDQSLPTKTVTILSSDVAGYSLMMATNEQETLEFFNFCKEVFEEVVENNQGRVFNTAGDAILAEFDYVFNAVHCAVEIQKELRAINLGQPEGRRVLFRMGLNTGEVFVQDGDLLGDAVNIAARLQSAAKPGGICLSGEIHDLIANKVSHTFTPLGKLTFKNIPEPVRTFALSEDDGKFKPPIPDLKATAFQAPTPKKVSAKNAARSGESNVLRNSLLLAAALAGAAFWFWPNKKVPEAPTPAALAAAAAASQPGHVFLATTPDSVVTLTLGGQKVFQGSTPVQNDLAPGTYRMKIENKDLGISEEQDLAVESGKFIRFEKILSATKGLAAGSQAGNAADAALTPLEIQERQSADGQSDIESAYRFGKSRLDKGKAEEAFPYLSHAATNEHGPAQLELGKMFYTGAGVPKRDFEAALYWLLKASLSNVPGAIDFLERNKFPQEFARNILNQSKIAANNPSAERLRTAQKQFLENDLGPTLKDRGLPH